MRWRAAAMLTVTASVVSAPAASPHSGHAPLEIDLANFAFAPKDAVVYQGDSVVFTWKGPDTNHSATGDDFDSDAGKSPATVLHQVGDTYTVSFSRLGTVTYHCKVHPSMTGTVRVDPIPGVPPPAPPKLTAVSVKPRAFARVTTLHFSLDGPSTVSVQLRKGSKVVKRTSFSAHPGANSKRLSYNRRVRAGKYVLKLTATDPSSGLESSASVRVRIKR